MKKQKTWLVEFVVTCETRDLFSFDRHLFSLLLCFEEGRDDLRVFNHDTSPLGELLFLIWLKCVQCFLFKGGNRRVSTCRDAHWRRTFSFFQQDMKFHSKWLNTYHEHKLPIHAGWVVTRQKLSIFFWKTKSVYRPIRFVLIKFKK